MSSQMSGRNVGDSLPSFYFLFSSFFFIFEIYFYFVYLGVLPACLSTHHMCIVPVEARGRKRVSGVPRAGFRDNYYRRNVTVHSVKLTIVSLTC